MTLHLNPSLRPAGLVEMPALLRGDAEAVDGWLHHWSTRRALLYLVVIFLGAGLYGAAMGVWRSPLQAVFTAVKFPLIILLTTLGNALLNGMLAPLLGLNIRFRQSLLAIFMSFTIAAAILGAFSPLLFFIVWNAPPMSPSEEVSTTAYSSIKLAQVAVIAFAGVAANLRLAQLLRRLSGSAAVTRRVLCAWLAGNLFLGTQLTWILRPFIGSPHLQVEFLRPDPFHSNFFETVFNTIKHLLFP